MPTVGVFAAVFNSRGEALCVRHGYGARDWGMPGGMIEPGEDPITAVKREIVEETGYHAEITDLVGVYSAPYRDDLVLLFKGHVLDRSGWSPNGEISECGFFPLTKLPAPMAANPKSRFDDLKANLHGVFCTFIEPGVRSTDLSLDPS